MIITILLIASPAKADYLDECLKKIVPMNDGSYIAAVGCSYLDFFIYIGADGKVIKRNYVPLDKRDTLKLIDYTPDDRMYLLYVTEGEGDETNMHGMVCDFMWKKVFDTPLEQMMNITMFNGAWY